MPIYHEFIFEGHSYSIPCTTIKEMLPIFLQLLQKPTDYYLEAHTEAGRKLKLTHPLKEQEIFYSNQKIYLSHGAGWGG